MRCWYKIRHPSLPKEGTLQLNLNPNGINTLYNENKNYDLKLHFDTPERGKARGQMAGIYNKEGVCLGGGEIHC